MVAPPDLLIGKGNEGRTVKSVSRNRKESDVKRFIQLSSIFCILTCAIGVEGFWPGDEGIRIGGNLLERDEPSGAVWLETRNQLAVVCDEGDVILLNSEGVIEERWDKTDIWNKPGMLHTMKDLEGVTVVPGDTNLIYLGIENPDSIYEFNISNGGLTGKSWDLTGTMMSPPKNGLEALTFVPNSDHPYEPSDFGGLFYVGQQSGGNIYVFDLDPSGTVVTHVDTIASRYDDLSGLHYDASSGILYAVYDKHKVVVKLGVDGNVWAEYFLPVTDQEGIAVVPESSDGKAALYIVEDNAGNPEIRRYNDSPILLKRPFPDIKANGLDGPVVVTKGEEIAVSLALEDGGLRGENIHCWILAETPMGVYGYTLNGRWGTDLSPVYGGAAFDLSPLKLFEISPSAGQYRFYFAVQTGMPGGMDSKLFIDSVYVTVEPPVR